MSSPLQGPSPQDREALLDAAEELIWSVLDDQDVDDTRIRELEALIAGSTEVRDRYLECVQLHVDLQEHFAVGPLETKSKANTPVLGNLLTGGLPSGFPTPAE